MPLQPIYHMSSFLGVGVPVFEIRDVARPAQRPAGAQRRRSARRSPRCWATRPVVLMRGHGSVTVGTSIPQVVFRAYYTEMNARLQAEAIKLGAVTYLTPRRRRPQPGPTTPW